MTDLDEARHQLPPGTRLQNGKYQIVRTLGQGGFGITYLALHETFGEVALKELFLNAPNVYCTRSATEQQGARVVPNQKALFETFKQRFREEARMLYKLRKIEGVVKVHDFFDENGTVYLPMEYLKGEKLQDYVQVRGRLPLGEGIPILQSLAQTLQKVHQQGVLHRDIKPANIIIGDSREVTLIDFGIAREYVDDSTEHTTYHTPGYAPPEQKIASLKLGRYSDIYSLGGTAYFMFTGIAPQSSDERHIRDYVSPAQLVPELPGPIVMLIDRCLALRPEARFQDMEALIEAVPVMGALPVAQPPSPPKARALPAPLPTLPAASYETELHRAPKAGQRTTTVTAEDARLPGAVRSRDTAWLFRWFGIGIGAGLLVVFASYAWFSDGPDDQRPSGTMPDAAPLPQPDSLPGQNLTTPLAAPPDAQDSLFFEQHKNSVARLVKGLWKSGPDRLEFGDYSARANGREEGYHWSLAVRRGGFALLIEDENYVPNLVFHIKGPFVADSARLELQASGSPAAPVTFFKSNRRK